MKCDMNRKEESVPSNRKTKSVCFLFAAPLHFCVPLKSALKKTFAVKGFF